MYRSVNVRTATDEKTWEVTDALTLEEILRAKHLPPNLFQGYTKSGGNVKPILLNTRVADIPSSFEIVLQCIRNTDLKDVIPQKTSYKKVIDPVTTISNINIGPEGCTEILNEINPDQARSIVKNKISDFIKKYSNAELIVVGISGGGDSNTLVQGLKEFSTGEPGKKFLFFTLIFEPLWPESAAERASVLCQENNVEHQIYNPRQMEQILDMKGDLTECYNEFCKRFGGNTGHFFGTFLISLVARNICRKHKTNEYILGFNREDLLAELLFSLMNGQKPLPFPVRRFGEIKLLMPLWEVTKLLLDACYPKYARSNYEERKDVTTFQRNMIYYLAHGVEDVHPNLGLSLMHGVSKLFAENWAQLQYDNVLDLYPSEYADLSKTEEVREFLAKYFSNA